MIEVIRNDGVHEFFTDAVGYRMRGEECELLASDGTVGATVRYFKRVRELSNEEEVAILAEEAELSRRIRSLFLRVFALAIVGSATFIFAFTKLKAIGFFG